MTSCDTAIDVFKKWIESGTHKSIWFINTFHQISYKTYLQNNKEGFILWKCNSPDDITRFVENPYPTEFIYVGDHDKTSQYIKDAYKDTDMSKAFILCIHFVGKYSDVDDTVLKISKH